MKIAPSAPTDTIVCLSGLIASLFTAVECACPMAMGSPMSYPHTRTILSRPEVTNRSPEPSMAAVVICRERGEACTHFCIRV